MLEAWEGTIDPFLMTPTEEFRRRQTAVWKSLDEGGFDVGFVVFSDEHYCGGVPYLGGNTNISIEQVAGLIGPAAWASFIGKELGCEDWGFKVMVGANEANRTLIGKALNRPIRKGDWVYLEVAPTRDGLNSCIRRSVIAVESPAQVAPEQRYRFRFIEQAYRVGHQKYVEVARDGLPARLQEQALVDFFASKAEEVSRGVGKPIPLAQLKFYTGTHNAGYTECQEFFGAITLDRHEPLGHPIATMLDVALRGFGSRWNEVIIPGFDYIVIENTLGKYGPRVRTLTRLPLNVQRLVGNVDELAC